MTKKVSPENTILTEMELADRWGKSIHTLRRNRANKVGPAYFYLNSIHKKQLRYRLSAIVEYEKHMKEQRDQMEKQIAKEIKENRKEN